MIFKLLPVRVSWDAVGCKTDPAIRIVISRTLWSNRNGCSFAPKARINFRPLIILRDTGLAWQSKFGLVIKASNDESYILRIPPKEQRTLDWSLGALFYRADWTELTWARPRLNAERLRRWLGFLTVNCDKQRRRLMNRLMKIKVIESMSLYR